jgi:hypothetical protein
MKRLTSNYIRFIDARSIYRVSSASLEKKEKIKVSSVLIIVHIIL